MKTPEGVAKRHFIDVHILFFHHEGPPFWFWVSGIRTSLVISLQEGNSWVVCECERTVQREKCHWVIQWVLSLSQSLMPFGLRRLSLKDQTCKNVFCLLSFVSLWQISVVCKGSWTRLQSWDLMCLYKKWTEISAGFLPAFLQRWKLKSWIAIEIHCGERSYFWVRGEHKLS